MDKVLEFTPVFETEIDYSPNPIVLGSTKLCRSRMCTADWISNVHHICLKYAA